MKLYICENKIFMEEVNLKIFSDIPCEVYVDNDLKAVAKKNTLTKVPVRQGEYYVQLVSTVNSRYKIERVVSLDYDKVLNVQFSELVHLHPEWLRDTDVVWVGDYQSSYRIKNLVTGEIVSSSYDYVNSTNDFKNGISIVRKNKLTGVVNIYGKEILPCSFEQISILSENLLKVKHNGKYLLLSSQSGKKMNDYCYDDIQVFVGRSIVGYRDDGCAFLNNNGGEDLFLSQYKYSEGFRNSFAIVSTYTRDSYNRKYGVINRNGDEVLPCMYDYIGFFSNGLNQVEKDDKRGVVDHNGNEIIPCVYEALGSSYSCGLIYAKQNGKYGFINLKGEIIIPFKYDDIHDWSWVNNNDYWCRYFSESGIAIVSVRSSDPSVYKYGLVTKDGKEIFPCRFSKRPYIILKDQVCLIDNKDRLFIVYPDGQYRALKYQYVGRLKGGLAYVKYNDLYGYIDENLNEVIPCIYEHVGRCSQNHLFIVCKNKYYGVVDKDGTEIIPFKYNRLEAWGNGLLKAAIYENDNYMRAKWGVITEDGREVIPCIYDKIGSNHAADLNQNIDECINFLEENIIPVRKGKGGYVDGKGNEIIPCIYRSTRFFRNGIGIVYLNDQCNYIDKYGNIL